MKKLAPSILSLLTQDLLLKILDRIDSDLDRKSWRLVCKDFHRVDSLHRRSIRVIRPDSLSSLLRTYRSLELLDLSICPRIDDRSISLAFSASGRAQRLRSLVLSRASGLRSGGLALAVRSCPSLESIDVSHCCVLGDHEAAAISLAAGLRDLKLVKCLGVTDVGLAKIAVRCGALRSLNLKWCLKITDLGIDLLSKKCRDLKVLDISYLKVTNHSLRSIASLPKLEALSMVGCSFFDDDGLDYLGNGSPSLQIINISRCDNVSSCGLNSVIKGHEGLRQINAGNCFPELSMPFLSKLKDLKSLNSIRLDGFRVSTSILQIIGLSCKSLVEMGLSKCSGVTDEGITELVSSCMELRTLDLTCCHLLTDDAILAVANSCKKLACLKLESCALITEKGLDKLGSCCPFLQEVDLTDCSINDTGLKCLSKCSELVDLKLGLCPNISDKGLIHIGSNCKKLKELDLYRCSEIGDDGLAALASGCKKLRRLNLCYCSQITDRGLKYLSSLEELADLELRRLVKISNLGVALIAIGCKSLVELDLKRCYLINDMGLWVLIQHARNLRQLNISYCPVSDAGLYALLGNLECLMDVKLVHITRASPQGFELALRACCDRLKKVKLPGSLKHLLSLELIQTLQARGCRIRWIDKPLVLV
ncbi:F-box/LRR-repeat protein 3 isoform X1 [Magnolia sinica]|uniref:F-box/LRR-repeat protein 3 isoform X1 n=1 Tax=Magnolia sinica TaxID=86752 RepID=UPI00265AAFC2|nr:F-box/LRR-repeat protein 3 isoform X1 [Magnolia sinica]